MWGSNAFGQLGCGELIVDHKPIKFLLIPIENTTLKKKLGLKIVELVAGSHHCLALAQNSEGQKTLFSWGNSILNQCGHGINSTIWEPKAIDYFKDHVVDIISAGDSGSVVKTEKGVFEFGMKTFLSKDMGKSNNLGIRELKFEWGNKIRDSRLAENTAAFLVDYWTIFSIDLPTI